MCCAVLCSCTSFFILLLLLLSDCFRHSFFICLATLQHHVAYTHTHPVYFLAAAKWENILTERLPPFIPLCLHTYAAHAGNHTHDQRHGGDTQTWKDARMRAKERLWRILTEGRRKNDEENPWYNVSSRRLSLYECFSVRVCVYSSRKYNSCFFFFASSSIERVSERAGVRDAIRSLSCWCKAK